MAFYDLPESDFELIAMLDKVNLSLIRCKDYDTRHNMINIALKLLKDSHVNVFEMSEHELNKLDLDIIKIYKAKGWVKHEKGGS